ncbi:DNA helicase [Streptomyces phage Yara]|nr:DNA helicase [Streptomyces phage Yara]
MSGPMVKINLSEDGKRIELRSPYFVGVSEMCQGVPGASWSKTRRTWSYPLSLQTCRLLRVVFTDMLKVGKELSQWAWKATREEEAMRSLGKLSDTELDRVSEILPKIGGAMSSRTYQRVGAAFMARSAGGILLADEPGLGKTIQTLGGIVERGIEDGPHLVACPATAVRITWEKEVRKWTDFQVFAATGSPKQKQAAIEAAQLADGPRFLIINPETARVRIGRWCSKCKMFEEDFTDPYQDVEHRENEHKTQPRPWEVKFPDLFNFEWNSVTVDEAHRFLSGIKGTHNKTQVGEGMCRLRVKPGDEGLKVALTGTPIKGIPGNFWGVLHWLYPEAYKSKWTWAQQYLDVQEGRFGSSIGGIAEHRREALYRSLDAVMLRRTKAEVAPDLPPRQLVEHWCDPSPEQLRQYEEMREAGEAMFGEKYMSVTGTLAELTMLKQIATAYQGTSGPVMSKSCKWTFLLELLEERGVVGPASSRYDDGKKYVIASQFTKVINAMEKEFAKLKVATLKITGDVTPAKRREFQEDFQTPGGPRIMLLNTLAGGVAIDLDQQCDELFFMDETYVPDDQEQVEGRIHRVSRIHNVMIHYLYARGSIDERIAESNVSKDEVQKILLDGRRGVEFAIRLLKENS